MYHKINPKGQIDPENAAGLGKFKSEQPDEETHNHRLPFNNKDKFKRQETDNKSKARVNR